MIGKQISHYKIVERIGSGGMGDVYKAEDLDLPRHVALKFLSRETTRDKNQAKRFAREAQAVSALEHPNVCTVYEVKETPDGRMYIAMAYYEGRDIRELLAEGEMTLENAIAYTLAIADGLDHAHRRGIIHRDIKPANIMVTAEGVVKILDFGLAKLSGASRVTTSGTTLGTLAYMSPEQTSDAPVDHRTDIYSLGVTLYEMITGICPFLADYDAAIVYKILHLDPTPMEQIRGAVPQCLETIVRKAIDKDPESRYQDIDEMVDDLLELLHEISPSRATRFSALRSRARRGRSRRAWAGVAAVIAVTAIAAIVWQRGPVSRWLGLYDLGDAKGIVVLAEVPNTTSPPPPGDIGFGLDLTARIQALAPFESGLWVVPAREAGRSGVTEASRAQRAFGVNGVITYARVSGANGTGWQLRLWDAATNNLISVTELDDTSPDWPTGFDAVLAGVLGVDIPAGGRLTLAAGDPHAPAAYNDYLQGLGYAATPDGAGLDSALAAFDRAIYRDSLFADAYTARARALYANYVNDGNEDWAGASREAIAFATRIDPSQASPRILGAQLDARDGRAESSIAGFEAAIAANPRDPDARRQLGRAYFSSGDYEKAEEIYKHAVAVNPRFWGPYADLGYYYYATGRYGEAVSQFEEVARFAPDHAPTYNYLGALYYVLEDWDRAIVMFEKSFDLGKNYEACANLGTLYYMKGRFGDAAEMYEWAWEYDRSDHLVIGNLGSACYWIDGQRDRARELFDEAAALAGAELLEGPEDAVLLSVLAGYNSVDHPAEAIDYAERAIALAPNNSEVLYRSALTYEIMGNRARALLLLGEAIDNGYPVKEIEHERLLQEIREDRRYRLLVSRPDQSED